MILDDDVRVDQEHYVGGRKMTACTESSDAPDDVSAVVRVALGLPGKPLNDPRNLLLDAVSCGCGSCPDPKLSGPRGAIDHLEQSALFRAQVEAFRSHRSRRRWRKATVIFLFATGRQLPKPMPHTVMASDTVSSAFLNEHRGRVLQLPNGDAATPLGLDVDDLPETTTVPVVPVALLIGVSRSDTVRGLTASDRRVLDTRGFFDLRPTRQPRAALRTWLTSDNADVVRARELLRDDARRLGAVVVFAVRGALPADPARDLRQEVADLRARLARLEAVKPTSTDDRDPLFVD